MKCRFVLIVCAHAATVYAFLANRTTVLLLMCVWNIVRTVKENVFPLSGRPSLGQIGG